MKMNFRPANLLLLVILFESCAVDTTIDTSAELSVIVLGVAQDGGYPQAGCEKACCKLYFAGQHKSEKVVALGIVDRKSNKVWVIEATPDFGEQWRAVKDYAKIPNLTKPDGIFLTHAHIGHYTGLMQLGHEAMGAKDVPVYVMPRMKKFLSEHGPWSQLVDFNNIQLQEMKDDSVIHLTRNISITPFLVPHRDEYSETVGYRINSENTSLLFIPDINKWEKWDRDIVSEVSKVDHAIVDASFYKDGEIPGRDMSEILHPFIEETMKLFLMAEKVQKEKVIFIHLNHTNPALWDSKTRKDITSSGFKIAAEGDIIPLN
ncbi:MAG: MBL fold metallo-hydrolase [Flammeovirgaceae bacterium]|nr:MBL fold metallo-hydrolase [Flammeovirgaceae bacterium]